jgi:acetoacetyl-CoA synthetase
MSVWDDDGKEVIGEQGELVCTKHFPSMPIYFYKDEGDKKYRDAYFDVYENVWRHGDFAKLTKEGGLVVYGRSDATLNPGGVRIGTADIYRLVDEVMTEISDSIVVGFDKPLPDGTPEVHVILFVLMAEGQELTDNLIKTVSLQRLFLRLLLPPSPPFFPRRHHPSAPTPLSFPSPALSHLAASFCMSPYPQIKKTIFSQCSPRHVPKQVITCPSIPYTASGKKVELAVKKKIHGKPVKNTGALANPEALVFYGSADVLAALAKC